MNKKNIWNPTLIVVAIGLIFLIVNVQVYDKSKSLISKDAQTSVYEDREFPTIQESEIVMDKLSIDQEQWEYEINPEEITQQTHKSFYTTFDNDIKIHSCWCYGIKVNIYNPTETYQQEVKEGIEVIQLEKSRDLIFTDNANVFAYYDSEKQVTFSIIRDGLRTLRHLNYSVYIYPSGLISYVSSEGRIVLRNEWSKELTKEQVDSKIILEEVLQMENQYSNLILIKNAELGKRIN